MSDSVGKITLDLEVKSDLGKQISSISGIIAKNLKSSLNAGTKSMFDGMKKSANSGVKSLDSSIKSMLNKMRSNLKSTIKDAFESVKNVKMPTIKFPKAEVPKPNVSNIPKADNLRGPPVDIEKLQDIKLGKMQTLDITDRQIENLRNKLRMLEEQLKSTFNLEGRNKLERSILTTEARMDSLINKSIKLGSEITELDSKMASASNGTRKLGQNSESAGGRVNKLSSQLTKLGFGAKKVTGHLNGTNSQLKMIIRSMITWGMIFPLIIRGIKAMATSIGQSLMTNQQFANSLAQIKTNLMVAFTPIYQAILPALNTLMAALAKVTTYIASFISSIFGKTYKQSYQATQQLIDAKTAMGAYGDSAKKAAKDVKGLAAIDEINTLGATNANVAGVNDKIPQMVAPPIDTSAVDSSMSALSERVKAVFATLFQPFKNAWSKDGASVIAEVKRAIEATKQTFINFYDVLATPPVQLFIENVSRIALSLGKIAIRIYTDFILPVVDWFISLLPGAADGLNPILEKVRQFVDYLSGDGFKYIKLGLSSVIGLVAGFKLFKILTPVAELFKNFKAVVSGSFTALTANPIVLVIASIAALVVAFTALYASNEDFRNKVNEVAGTLRDLLAPAFEFLKGIVLDIWNNALVPLGAFLADLWQTVLLPLGSIIGDVLVMAFQTLIDIVKIFWQNVLQPLVSFIVDIFIKAIEAVIDIYNAWKPVIEVVIAVIMFLWNNVLKPLVDFLLTNFIDTFSNVFRAIGGIIDSIKRAFGGIIDFIAGVFTGDWKRVWQGVSDIFGGIMGALGGLVKAPLNGVIGLINAAINGLNKIKLPSIDIPFFGEVGGWGFDIPNIPYLAKGGIVDSPTLAMVGEAGKEAVVPLENNTQGLDLLASKLIERLGGANVSNNGNDNDRALEIILQLGDLEFTRVIIDSINKLTKMNNGQCLIKV